MLRGSFLALGLAAGLSRAQPGLPTVAVLPLSVTSSDSASGGAYAEVLGDELLRGGGFRVLERAQIDRILKEQGFQRSGACDASECAVEVGRLLGIEQMVVGSVSPVGESRLFTLRRVDIATGEIKASLRRLHKGSPEQAVTDLLPQLAREIGNGEESGPTGMSLASNAAAAKQGEPRDSAGTKAGRMGWTLGASLQIQPEGIGIEESLRGGSVGVGWHFANAAFLEVGLGADLSLRHREHEPSRPDGGSAKPSFTMLSLDPALEAVLRSPEGVRLGTAGGIALPLGTRRYDAEERGSGTEPFWKLFVGWERKGVSADLGVEEGGAILRDSEGKSFDQRAFFLQVRVRLP